jgi:multidrug efflux system outer membrane protein
MNKLAYDRPLLAPCVGGLAPRMPALNSSSRDGRADRFKEGTCADAGEARPTARTWKQAQPAEAQPRGEWWLAFNDPALTELIAEATRANANLAVAAARVKQARALAGIAEADRIPQVGVGAGAQRSASPTWRSACRTARRWRRATLPGQADCQLRGRPVRPRRANVSAARADAAASEATYKSVLLAVQADVAQTYFRLRATDAELATLNRTVQTCATQASRSTRAASTMATSANSTWRAPRPSWRPRAEAIGLQRQRVQTEHALAVLLGKPAANYTRRRQPACSIRRCCR